MIWNKLTRNHACDSDRTWYTHRTFYLLVSIICIVVLIASFVNGVILKHNDFRNHYKLGAAFLQGRPYLMPNCKPFWAHYPVGRLMINAGLAIFPYRIARGVCWTISIIALVLSLKMWHQMAQQRRAVSETKAFAAAVLSLGILLRWVVRDLDDCGLQILLLFVLTAAGWAIMRHKSIMGGFLLALAATYKLTPVLFFPFLLYKRKWREAIWMVLFIGMLNFLLPMIFLGWQQTLDANGVFFAKAIEVAGATRDDPSASGVETLPRHVNRSLRTAIARYLQTYRPGHPLFIPHPDDVSPDKDVPSEPRPHPLFIQFLDLPAATINMTITCILLVFALILAVLFRHKWGDHLPDADLAPEWAVVTALCALLSPLCWGQHLVLMIPAVFLSVRTDLGRTNAKWRIVIMWIVFVFIIAPQREIIGRDLWLIIQSYKLDTIAALLCLFLVLTLPENSTTLCDNSQVSSGAL